MEPQSEGKSVLWSHMEEYLNLYNSKINPYVTLKYSGEMKVQKVEAKLPKLLFELHGLLTKILKDSNIIPNDEDSKLSQL
jgi:hypothetical protein